MDFNFGSSSIILCQVFFLRIFMCVFMIILGWVKEHPPWLEKGQKKTHVKIRKQKKVMW